MKLKPAKKPTKKDVWKKGTTVPKKATKKPESELHVTISEWTKILEAEDKQNPPRSVWHVASDLESCLFSVEKAKHCLDYAQDDFVDRLENNSRLISMVSITEDLLKDLESRLGDLTDELHKIHRVLKRKEAAAAKKSKS